MKLSDFKEQLGVTKELNFVLSNGTAIPKHFHVTEVGQVTKHFIDCGGTVRNEKLVSFQLWETIDDAEHRLAPQKLANIISLSEKVLNLQDAEIEVEYQSDTIGKYSLEYNGKQFILTNKKTNCLANDKCGISDNKQKVQLAQLHVAKEECCTPGGKCC